ncbi:hypothetical protein HK096_006346, partial [Nowakowskiella sp. JEL0078]
MEFKHIPGTHNIVADNLSRYSFFKKNPSAHLEINNPMIDKHTVNAINELPPVFSLLVPSDLQNIQSHNIKDKMGNRILQNLDPLPGFHIDKKNYLHYKGHL